MVVALVSVLTIYVSPETKSNVRVGRKSKKKRHDSTSSANYNWQAAQARPPAQFEGFSTIFFFFIKRANEAYKF